MARARRIVAVIGLTVIIAVAIIWIVRSRFASPTTPDSALPGELTRIDEKTGEIITLSWSRWESLGNNGPRFKNPKTGEYTMLPVVKCPHCGANVAAPMLSSGEKPVMEGSQCAKCGKLLAPPI